jgi:thiol-disulfide isomerase/thioredoxin
MLLILRCFYQHVPIKPLCVLVLTCLCPPLALATPDVLLAGVDGDKHNLNQYIGKGKWTVLNIWGTRCPPCLEEIPELIHFHDEHKDTKAIVVGIAIDFPSYGYAKRKEVLEFINEHLVDFPVLLSDASISEQIGVGILEGLPTTYLYTPEGDLVGMQIGGITGNILEAFIDRYEKKHASGPDSNNQHKKSE